MSAPSPQIQITAPTAVLGHGMLKVDKVSYKRVWPTLLLQVRSRPGGGMVERVDPSPLLADLLEPTPKLNWKKEYLH